MNIRRTAALTIATVAAAAGTVVTMASANAATPVKHGYECHLTIAAQPGGPAGIACSAQGDNGNAIGAFVVDNHAADSPGVGHIVMVCPVDAADDHGPTSSQWPPCRVCWPTDADRQLIPQERRLPAGHKSGLDQVHQQWPCLAVTIPRLRFHATA